jgi:superfamily II DNA or RNA helicase
MASVHAAIDAGEAVLSFPYDERLRLLLRALPGRRWDPVARVWRLPLDPEGAESLARLLAELPGEPRVSGELARTLARRRARRRRGECLIDLARPDGRWWLSCASDAPSAPLARLLAHPEAHIVEAIGRALIPLDAQSAALVRELESEGAAVRVTELARRELDGLARSARADVRAELRARAAALDGIAARRRARVSDGAEDGGGAEVAGGWEGAVPATPVPRRAALELSAIHEEPTFVLAAAHAPVQTAAFLALPGARGPRFAGSFAHEHAFLPALRADPFCVPALDAFLAAHDTAIEPAALAALQEVREQHAHAAGLVALSAAHAAELEVAGLGGELKPFQRAGVAYLLSQRRAFLADEQGLGKTIEALAALEAAGSYPAVVVCPASLKLNWLRELERWLPGRTVRVLAGTRPRPALALPPAREVPSACEAPPAREGDPADAADVTLVNYEILAARVEELRALGPRALVLDESHYCKNARAGRTRAAQRLAAAVPQAGLVLALTGTPLMNRPAELVAQLRILGRLADFGSGVQFGRRFRGPDAHVRLHWHLRARCFVRRLKADVLPQLPPKTRAIVPVELDNEAEYRLAERDLVAWLRSQPLDLGELDARVAAALRAERLVRLNALKLLAARGKLHAALAWIHDFLRSGERLVVFARHREIQEAVRERFPGALHILGADSPAAREAALRAFQGEDRAENQLIVCSLEVAGQGITLTRASHVAFLELDWTPARHDQAEDRCHRIGQLDAVNASYLLAADTVDETIAELLERKRAVIGAVTDGREQDEEGVVDALVRALRGTPYRHLRAA